MNDPNLSPGVSKILQQMDVDYRQEIKRLKAKLAASELAQQSYAGRLHRVAMVLTGLMNRGHDAWCGTETGRACDCAYRFIQSARAIVLDPETEAVK